MAMGKMTMAYKGTRRRARRKRKSKTKKVEDDVNVLMQQMNASKCIKDIQKNSTVSSDWGNFQNLFKTKVGNGQGDREGLNIIAKGFHIQGYIKKADVTNRVRLVVVMFESSDDNSIENVMQFPVSNNSFPNQTINTFFKVNGDCKYKILADKEYKVGTTATYAKVNIKVKIPRKRSLQKFTSTSTENEADSRTNSISIFAVSDSTASLHPQVVLNIRQRFLA